MRSRSAFSPSRASWLDDRGAIWLAPVEERSRTRVRVARSRRDAGIEIEVETDRAAVLGLEVRQLPQAVPAHSLCHLPLSLPDPARF